MDIETHQIWVRLHDKLREVRRNNQGWITALNNNANSDMGKIGIGKVSCFELCEEGRLKLSILNTSIFIASCL